MFKNLGEKQRFKLLSGDMRARIPGGKGLRGNEVESNFCF